MRKSAVLVIALGTLALFHASKIDSPAAFPTCAAISRHRDADVVAVKAAPSTTQTSTMAYSWDNRVNFVISHLYDIDSNGYLDERDFACLALRATIIEGKGEFSFSRLHEYQHIMMSLWEEIAELADFNKDGKITTDEFKQAVQQCCMGRRYEDFPQAMKLFIDSNFKMVDLNDDGVIGAEEYRFNCITKFAIEDIEVVDEAFNNLLSDDDRRRGGITLSRYQELYAQFLGNPDETCPAVYLFGPLSEFYREDGFN